MRLLLGLVVFGVIGGASIAACDDDGGSAADTRVTGDTTVTDTTVDDTAVDDSTVEDTVVADTKVTLPDPATVALAGPCAADVRWGRFVVEANSAYSTVQGTLSNGVVPATVPTVETDAGGCRLLRRVNPVCDPPCQPGTTCDFGGMCITYPEPQGLGEVVIDGLAQPVSMSPVQPGNNYFDTTLPHPAFAAAETIALTMTEGFAGATTLYGVGGDSMTLTSDMLVLDRDTDLPLTWSAPVASPTRTEVAVTLLIDQHGNSPVTLECVFDDTGSAAVPATMVTALIDAGVSGYPSGKVSRRTVDSAMVGAGCLELVVHTLRVPTVRAAGFTPCTKQSDCPDPQFCNVPLEICQGGGDGGD